ncbi:MAG: insulinase family protein, partial [Lachnospiraceae bacterium]|nr:insulinase family protein [Lachnospiraceae bacterium]
MKFTNYELIKKQSIPELKSEGYLLRHKKSGARVVLLSNDDENKVFTIGFRTPPENSKGVQHIIEHSVLCGSKLYPAKDPFVELVKGSLNTFLNAITYPDKTIYPIASCNDTDFQNLMHVYVDAVFNPNIYERKQIFMQEGWHYELENEDDELKYNGVVYNEMKGAYSSPDEVLNNITLQTLFPDTCYSKDSGGRPDVITDLSYEEFLEYHRTHYHPSNSYIYLYGNMDMDEKLEFLDREYLSKYDAIEVDTEIRSQPQAGKVKEVTGTFSVTEGDTDTKSYLSYNVLCGNILDKELYLAMQMLDYALLSSSGAPLKQALIDAGIGSDVYGSYLNIKQPVYSIIAKDADEKDKDRFVKIIKDTLRELADNGIDKNSLLAGINYFEFKYREADFGQFPKGLMYGIQAFDSWLYDDNEPFMHIQANDTIEFLKNNVDSGYFENIIKKYLLDEDNLAIVVLNPEESLTKKQDDITKAKLADYKKTLSKEQIQEIIDNTKALKKYQEEPSTKEELMTIPLLKREDIRREAAPLYVDERDVNGVKVIYSDVYTNGIGYLKLTFNT